MNMVHTFDHACLEQINVLCTWCSITDSVLFYLRLDRVVLARWLHLQVILDPLDKHSTFLRSPFHHSLLCLI
jgi:hypothetical protein